MSWRSRSGRNRMRKKSHISILVFFFGNCFFNFSYAQTKRIDSLRVLFNNDKSDTARITHLNLLAREYIHKDAYDSAMHITNSVLQLIAPLKTSKKQEVFILKSEATAYSNAGRIYRAKKEYNKALGFYTKALNLDEKLLHSPDTISVKSVKKNMAGHLGNAGLVYADQNDYPKALEYYFRSLKMEEEIGDKNGMASVLGNIGLAMWRQGNYLQALDYYFRGLKLGEELGDKYKVASSFSNIGSIYYDQGDFTKAAEYYFKSLKIFEELGNKNRMAAVMGNIGNVLHRQGNYAKALDYYFKSLRLKEENKNKTGVASTLGNIGLLYKEKADEAGPGAKGNDSLYKKALQYYLRALAIDEELKDKSGRAINLGNIGEVYASTKKYDKASDYLAHALAIDLEIGEMNNVKTWYQLLSNLYEKTNVPLPDTIGGKMLNMEQVRLKALYYHKQFISIRDTLFSEENKKQLVRKEMNFEFEKKAAAAKAENEKKEAIQKAETRKQQIILFLVSGFLFLVLLFAGLIFRSLRITKKQKAIIEHQKELVDEKQKEILDSIRYAKRIQTALITSEKYIERNLNKMERR